MAGRPGASFHPRYEWFADLALRWPAVPAIANMCPEIGGICYPAAPFNGWYMGSEIGARNLADADRYNLLPVIAERLGLDTADERSRWRDRALVELNLHLAREQRAGRITPADWSWIVPPISGAATPVFHRYYDTADLRPDYVHHPQATPVAHGVAPT
jgi:nitric-oxide synthase, bacterial